MPMRSAAMAGLSREFGEHGVECLLHLPRPPGELDVAAPSAHIVHAVARMADGSDDEAMAGQRARPVAVVELVGAAAMGQEDQREAAVCGGRVAGGDCTGWRANSFPGRASDTIPRRRRAARPEPSASRTRHDRGRHRQGWLLPRREARAGSRPEGASRRSLPPQSSSQRRGLGRGGR